MSCGDGCDQGGVVDGCRCDGGQPKNFLRPCVLLLLAEQPAHGYELLDRLKGFGFSRDPGGLYRVLRTLERDGQVCSQWEVSVSGPDRCRYELTALGRDWLTAWTATLAESRRTLNEFLGRAAALDRPGRSDAVPAALRSIISSGTAAGSDDQGPGEEEEAL